VTALARRSSDCMDKLQTRPLVREGATKEGSRKCLKTFHTEVRKIGRGSQMVAWYQDRLADWPLVLT
jgi:hypothetical protein